MNRQLIHVLDPPPPWEIWSQCVEASSMWNLAPLGLETQLCGGVRGSNGKFTEACCGSWCASLSRTCVNYLEGLATFVLLICTFQSLSTSMYASCQVPLNPPQANLIYSPLRSRGSSWLKFGCENQFSPAMNSEVRCHACDPSL